MLHIPYYNPKKSYDENYKEGPFGAFANAKQYQEKNEPQYDFLGEKVYLPFGIPAGPIINSAFVKSAFQKGFDLVVYKTVRSAIFPCHPYPNILPLSVKGNLTLKKIEKPIIVENAFHDPINITNSFGVPSKDVKIWQTDVKKAIKYAGKGQVLILSFMGTVRHPQTQQEFIDDYALAAKQSVATGAKILEANLSCPNIGNEGLVCYNLKVTREISKAIRKEIGKKPLILKTGYFKNEADLEEFAAIANEYVQGIAAINTLQAAIVDKKGEQALPGNNRLRSGICGAGIKWAGLDMVKRLNAIRKKRKYSFKIIGVGGVVEVKDYFEYMKAGADAVMSATGSMWNPYLAQEIKKFKQKK